MKKYDLDVILQVLKLSKVPAATIHKVVKGLRELNSAEDWWNESTLAQREAAGFKRHFSATTLELWFEQLSSSERKLVEEEFAKRNPQVVIEVVGGCVSDVYATSPLNVTIRDHDNIKAGNDDPLEGKDLSKTPGWLSVA